MVGDFGGRAEERNFVLGTTPDKITEIYRWTKQVLLRGWTAAMHSAGHRKVLNRSHGPFFPAARLAKKKKRKKVLRAVVGFDSEGLPVPLVGDRRPPATGAAVKRKKRPICRTRKTMEAEEVTRQSAICGLDWVRFLQGCFLGDSAGK